MCLDRTEKLVIRAFQVEMSTFWLAQLLKSKEKKMGVPVTVRQSINEVEAGKRKRIGVKVGAEVELSLSLSLSVSVNCQARRFLQLEWKLDSSQLIINCPVHQRVYYLKQVLVVLKYKKKPTLLNNCRPRCDSNAQIFGAENQRLNH